MGKVNLRLQLIVWMTLICASVNGQETYERDGVNYEIWDANMMKCAVSSNQDYSGTTDIVIPETININGQIYTVSWILHHAFDGNEVIKSVKLPSTLEMVDSYSFANCNSLESVSIDNGETSNYNFGQNAFDGSTNISHVNITSIENWCGYKFPKSSSTVASSNPLNYGASLYVEGVLVEDLQIPEGVTKLEQYSFYGCSSIKSVWLPVSMKSIMMEAFGECRNLKKIEVESLSSYCNIFFEEGYGNVWGGVLLSQGRILYVDGEAVYDLTIPEDVTEISDRCFMSYEGLLSVKFGENLKKIGADAFSSCGLKELTLPGTITAIGASAFYDNPLTKITLESSTAPSYGEVFNTYYKTATLQIPEGSLENYLSSVWVNFENISEGGNEIGTFTNNGFTYRCNPATRTATLISEGYGYYKGLNEIDIPAEVSDDDGQIEGSFQVTAIGYRAFHLTTSLLSAKLPEGLIEIGESAFQGCQSLGEVYLPSTLKTIGKSAFQDCALSETLELPCQLESIGQSAFNHANNITKLEFPSTLKTLGSYAFAHNSGLESVDMSAATELNTIGGGAFSGCYTLKSLNLPPAVEVIDSFAFNGCSLLDDIAFPKTLVKINYQALTGTAIKTLDLSGYQNLEIVSVSFCRELEWANLSNCPRLNMVDFYYNQNIKEVDLSGCESLTNLGKDSFNGCDELTTLKLPYSLKTIQERAFFSCPKLKNIVLPPSLELIEDYNFQALQDVESITNLTAPAVEMNSYSLFNTTTFENATLYVLPAYVENYRTTVPWSNFTTILPLNAITSIVTNPEAIEIEEGESIEISASYEPSDAYFDGLVWEIGNASVASLEETAGLNNRLTGGKPGETVIKVVNRYDPSTFKEVTVKVTEKQVIAQSLTLDPEALSTPLNGLSLSVTAVFEPSNTTMQKVAWSSSDESVASVDEEGLLTWNGKGVCRITATTLDGSNLTATCDVTVTEPIATSLAIEPTQLTLTINESYTLSVTVNEPEGGVMPNPIVWESSDENVATVDPTGKVNAQSVGRAVITASGEWNGVKVSADCEVTVVPVPVKGISLEITSPSIDLKDGTMSLAVTISPAEAEIPNLKWKSSNENIATVSSTGLLEAELIPLSAGKTTISVHHSDDETINDSAEITVTDKSSIGDVLTDGTFEGAVDVYDLSGRLIKRNADKEDLQDLRPGIYIFRDGVKSNKVLVK